MNDREREDISQAAQKIVIDAPDRPTPEVLQQLKNIFQQ